MTGKDTHTHTHAPRPQSEMLLLFLVFLEQLRLLSGVNKLTADRLIKCRIQLGPDQLRMRATRRIVQDGRIVVLEWATLCPAEGGEMAEAIHVCLALLAKGQSQHIKLNASNEAGQPAGHSSLPLPPTPQTGLISAAAAALNSEKNFINNARKIVRNCQNNLC